MHLTQGSELCTLATRCAGRHAHSPTHHTPCLPTRIPNVLSQVEDEAVIAHAAKRVAATHRLISTSEMIPQLQRRPGMQTWRVMHGGSWYDTFEDLPAEVRALGEGSGSLALTPNPTPNPSPSPNPTCNPILNLNPNLTPNPNLNLNPTLTPSPNPNQVRAQGKMLPTMFPLPPDEMGELGLEHAMRVLPHMQARSEHKGNSQGA